jgi:hypothetical protein
MGVFEIGRRHLLNVFCDAIERWVILADQRAAGMIDKPAELQCADVIDPFRRRARIGDHIFTIGIVEVAIVHSFILINV